MNSTARSAVLATVYSYSLQILLHAKVIIPLHTNFCQVCNYNCNAWVSCNSSFGLNVNVSKVVSKLRFNMHAESLESSHEVTSAKVTSVKSHEGGVKSLSSHVVLRVKS